MPRIGLILNLFKVLAVVSRLTFEFFTQVNFEFSSLPPVIMGKSLGTNLHLWRFFTRAKQTVRREFIYACSAPSPHPAIYIVGHVHTLFLQSFNIVLAEAGVESNAF